MNTKKKTLLIVLGIVLLVGLVGAFLGIYFANQPKTEAGGKAYSLSVIHKDNTEKKFELTTNEEYLGAALLSEGIISGTMGDFGLMVEVVDGEKAVWAEDGAYWALYIGEEYATTGVDTTPVTDGGVYKWEYTLAS